MCLIHTVHMINIDNHFSVCIHQGSHLYILPCGNRKLFRSLCHQKLGIYKKCDEPIPTGQWVNVISLIFRTKFSVIVIV
jgi:hypothetical protein